MSKPPPRPSLPVRPYLPPVRPHSRRTFLRSSAATLAAISPSLAGLVACAQAPARAASDKPSLRQVPGAGGGYGPITPYQPLDGLISLPVGFRAAIISRSGRPMSDGGVLPNAFDGMGAFATGTGQVRLIRNHELRSPPGLVQPFGSNPYDEFGPGGTTSVDVRVGPDGTAELVGEYASLTGTFVNCAGGITPWGSWISCEEAVAGTDAGWGWNHGYNFEVPVTSLGPVTPVPLKAMGRFTHEALAVDPDTGWVYQTEDRTPSGFYRFVPAQRGNLAAGGELWQLKIVGHDGFETRNQDPARPSIALGAMLDVEWVRIDEPDTDAAPLVTGFVFNQGLGKGAAQFARLEGCWWGDGSVYFNATSGGAAGAGQVWRYVPASEKLVLVFESPSPTVLNSPDNIAVSPRGGIVLCEDGPGQCFVRGITPSGTIFDLISNNMNALEWAGACFSPQGRTLFVNVQGSTIPRNDGTDPPSYTFAIWGPWETGAL